MGVLKEKSNFPYLMKADKRWIQLGYKHRFSDKTEKNVIFPVSFIYCNPSFIYFVIFKSMNWENLCAELLKISDHYIPICRGQSVQQNCKI